MRLYPLAYAAGLLPLLTANLTYLLSAWYGQVDWCLPYLHSCTSISGTGRLPPAYFVFKGLMIPAAVILMAYWTLAAAWLRHLGSRRRHWQTVLVAVGTLAAIGLIFYSTMLGSIDPGYRQPRHVGVSVFFGFSFFAQLLITWLLEQLPLIRQQCRQRLSWLRGAALAVLLLGLTNLVIEYIDPALYERAENAIAWNFMLLLCLHVLLTADLWRLTGWRFTFAVSDDG